MIVSFCGHRNIYHYDRVAKWLHREIENLIKNGVSTFYLGGYGSFDDLAKSLLVNFRKEYPNIKIYLVLAYFKHTKSLDGYDGTIYPPLETIPQKFAISKRNEWIIRQSSYLLAYVIHDYGGAYTMMRYAKRKRVNIIQFRTYEWN